MATANDLRQMTSEELGRTASELRDNLFTMRLKLRTGHLETTSELGRMRRELARIATLRREKELGLDREVKAKAVDESTGAAKSAAKKGAAKGRAKPVRAPRKGKK
jgi:large subunit ribosomal protein L29